MSSSSDPDDKQNPAYWHTGGEFFNLPQNVQKAVANAKLHQKHSEFYYKLK